MSEIDAPIFMFVIQVCVLLAVLAVYALIAKSDIRQRMVPNRLLLVLVMLRLLLSIFVPEGKWGTMAFVGSAVLGVVVLLVGTAVALLFERVFKKECLGMGDVKLFAVSSLFLGLDATVLMFVVSSIAGLMFALYYRFARNSRTFPFAPAICLGAILALPM